MQIIDGYCNEPNIFADDIGEYNTAIWGTRDCVLPAGEQLGYELISNNEIKIKDGVFSTQGRRGVIKKGAAESCIIENGTQAENRNDLIVIEYAKDSSTLIESHTLKVIKGTPGEIATDPDVVTGDIQAGDVLHQMPLYRVKLEGLNVVAVERLFSVGNNAIGKEFDPDKDYEIGDLTLQYNKAWKFKVKHLAGAWDESQMEETDVLTELAEQNKNFAKLNEKLFPDYKKVEAVLASVPDSATYTVTEDAYYYIYAVGTANAVTSLAGVAIDGCEVVSLLCNPAYNRSTGLFPIKKGSIVTCTSQTANTARFSIEKIPFTNVT